jgi:hypothetical protein
MLSNRARLQLPIGNFYSRAADLNEVGSGEGEDEASADAAGFEAPVCVGRL